jgi:hypothetical protein
MKSNQNKIANIGSAILCPIVAGQLQSLQNRTKRLWFVFIFKDFCSVVPKPMHTRYTKNICETPNMHNRYAQKILLNYS